MRVTLVNPIYDSVFKYLMEDDRVAKILLSAMLKKPVLSLDRRRNEYSNTGRTDISYFRIDFGAKVREEDGTERLVLIELQKTWLPSETLRFRQYLGRQYSDKGNIKSEGPDKGNALPMVSVYLLGHRVGDIETPILYVDRRFLDYDGNEVKKGLPNSFVDSLTHDSIIVQIPLLHGHVSNRLEQLLSIFDQTLVYGKDLRHISVDADYYKNDPDLNCIYDRLVLASVDPEVRVQMEVEEEFLSEIEDRDTQLLEKKKQIEQMDRKMGQLDRKMEQMDRKMEQMGKQMEQKDKQIEQKNAVIRTAAQSLLQSGMSMREVAEVMQMSEDDLSALLQMR